MLPPLREGMPCPFRRSRLPGWVPAGIFNSALPDKVDTDTEPPSAARVNFISEEEINFYGNEQLIEQAVTNLIVNAIKYSHSDVIDVKLTKTDNNIRIDVTDYGIGIAPEHLDRIFLHVPQPFYQ